MALKSIKERLDSQIATTQGKEVFLSDQIQSLRRKEKMLS